MTRVVALTKYGRKGPSSRLRFMQYEALLAEQGIALDMRALLSDRYLEILYATGRRSLRETAAAALRRAVQMRGLAAVDTVWLEGEVFPWAPEWLERTLLRDARRLVVDYDDPIFLRYEHADSGVMRAAFERKIAAIMRRADVVVAGNDVLAEHARSVGAREVVRIPTVVDVRRFAPPAPRAPDGPPVIGWIGTPQTRKYFEAVAPVLRALAAAGRARIRVVGGGDRPGLDPSFASLSWSEDTEVAAITGFDIGIMPLPDDRWARGKSGFKLIQYMAAGKPVVASPVGANRDLVEDGRTGLFATSGPDWTAALVRLLDDAALRASMGVAARAKAQSLFDVRVVVPNLVNALRG
ncbi:MAG: glycosyltransferase family 4 protein [Alphaproteobacteria bacterium]|nr:glycosyltransferase family 4 protein [Alphaproteobacteria bacterium]